MDIGTQTLPILEGVMFAAAGWLEGRYKKALCLLQLAGRLAGWLVGGRLRGHWDTNPTPILDGIMSMQV